MVTALHAAANRKDSPIVRLLREHKAEVNATDKSGFTPLLNAADIGEMTVVEILAAQGADLAARALEGGCAFGPGRRLHQPAPARMAYD